MNTKSLVAIAAVALSSGAVFAQDVDTYAYNYNPLNTFQSTRAREDVKAEAKAAVDNYTTVIGGSRVIVVKSTNDVKEVRSQAAQALRLGQISHGEIGA